MSTTKVNCIKCDIENSVDYDALKNLQFVKCGNCGETFNLFGVYRSLYDTNPLCKRMVDIAVEYTYAQYSVEASNAEEKNVIIQNLENNRFQEMLAQILQDKVLLGNCFLEMTHEDNDVKLQLLEPSELEYIIDWVQREPPARSYHQKIVAIKKHDAPFTEYDTKIILHFKGGLGSVDPIGDSIFGFWFTTWYFLRDMMNKYPLLDMQGEKYKDLKEFREFKESTVLGAAGIPHRLIFPWMKITNPRFIKIEDDRFQNDIEDRRNEISRKMERKFFPIVLQRDYEYENYPRLKWQAL